MPEKPLQRDVLPIPDLTPVGLTTYDAKDPATSFPPIEPLRPPEGAPNVLVILHRRRRLRRLERVRRPVRDADGRAPRLERAQVQPLPHDGALLAHAPGAPDRPQPPLGRDGRNHRDRDLRARLQLDPAEHEGAARRDPEAERLLDRAVREVPRGAGVGDEPDGAVQRLADGLRLRALLRLHRRRDEPVRAGDLSGHGPGRARSDAGGGLPLHRGHDRPRHRLDPPAEGADARQALLRLLRAGRDPRAAPRPAGVVGQVQGHVRRRLGRAPGADLREAEGARRHPARGGADRAAGRRSPPGTTCPTT